MKEAIKNSFSNSLKERIKKSLLEGINFTKQFISKRAKGIAIATVVIFGFGMILFQFTSVSMSGVANSTSGVLATSYLSSEHILKGINQIFSNWKMFKVIIQVMMSILSISMEILVIMYMSYFRILLQEMAKSRIFLILKHL